MGCFPINIRAYAHSTQNSPEGMAEVFLVPVFNSSFNQKSDTLNSNKFGFSTLKSTINKAMGWLFLVHMRHSSYITGLPVKSQLSALSIMANFVALLTLFATLLMFFRVKSFITSLFINLFYSLVILSWISLINLLLLYSSFTLFFNFSLTVLKISFDKVFSCSIIFLNSSPFFFYFQFFLVNF